MLKITHPDYPDERLVVCRNPFLCEDRRRTREELLECTEVELDRIVEATRREKRRLKGKENIGLRVGKVIGKYKVGKHFDITITDDGFSYVRNEQKIAREAATDGIFVIRTSVKTDRLSSEEAVSSYKSLSKVERAFRCMKTVDLHVRPINHRKPQRVESHIFICMKSILRGVAHETTAQTPPV